MVALDIVNASNARLIGLGANLVALFVGGTSGIGEFTLKAFVQNTVSPRVYLVGRNATAADRIIEECKKLNKDGKVEFLKADVTELKETQGNLTLNDRNESPEGLDRKMTLNYYSRMRFIYNLLPQLRLASTEPPHFARTLSILGAGHEAAINLSDLDLKTTFSGPRCANHTIVMNDFMAEEFAAREPGISFLHSNPSLVLTGLLRELPVWVRAIYKVAKPLLKAFSVGADETGQRQLYHATSSLYPPASLPEGVSLAGGVQLSKGLSVSRGSNGKVGSGAYIVNWNGDITGKENLLEDYREKEVGKAVWEHTMGVFQKVEKINQGRTEAVTL